MDLERESTGLCDAKLPKGGTCLRFAGAGTGHPGEGKCSMHNGNSEANERKAAKAEVGRMITTLKRLGKLDEDITPEQILLREISRSASAVAYFDELVQNIEPEEMGKWYAQSLIEMWNEQRTKAVAAAVAVIKAGLAERQMKLAEAQALALVTTIMSIFSDPNLALTPDQVQTARLTVAHRMRELVEIEEAPANA